jgi:tetratricopeptide (TPR) repeat protein
MPVAPPRTPASPAPPRASDAPHASDAPPKPQSFPPRSSPWRSALERVAREVEARAAQEPLRAALLLAAYARLCLDALGDPLRATTALQRAEELAPDARFVAATFRWLAEQGADQVAILQRTKNELAHVGEGRERTALLWHAAAVEGQIVGDLAAAKTTLRELLALDPNDLGAWDALAALHLQSRSEASEGWGDDAVSDEIVYAAVVEALEVTARATDDVRTRGALYAASGALRERYLDDVEGAIAALRRSLEADDGNAAAAASLEGILLRRRSWDDYAGLLTTQADKSRDARTAAEAYERAGDVYAECIGDLGRAAHCFVRAATMNERDPAPVEKLVAVLERAGLWEEAAAGYERLLPRIHDSVQKAWALVRLGSIHESRLERTDAALTAYRLAVEASPTFALAVQGLLRHARHRGLMGVVIELERREADRIADPNARAVRFAALAEVIEASASHGSTRTLEEATTLYERALALDPTNACAFDALDRIHRASGQWARVIALYETALATTGDRRRARALRVQLAELVHTRLHEPTRAAELLREALTGPEDRLDTLIALARALEGAGRWPEYVEALEAQASMLSGADEIAAVHRIAAALETRVKDTRRALSMYEIVVDRAPRHEAALRAIVRIHEQEARWERAIEAIRRLIDLATRPEDVLDGLLRIARISEEHLGRADAAIAAYGEALTRAPDHAPALSALEQLLRRTGDHRRLAQALRSFADATTDPRAKIRALMRAASILELCMDDTDSASAIYARAVAAAGPPGGGLDAERHAALWGLLRLQETRGEWDGVDRTLLELLDLTTEPGARLRVLARLARNVELRLSDLPRAAALYDDALAAGANPPTIAVDRLRVARLLGEHDAIAQSLAAMASCTTDRRLEEGLVRELAVLTEPRAPQQAATLYERLLARDPEDPHALDGRVRCASSPATDHRLPIALLARARATVDPSQRALVALGAGAIDDAAGRSVDAEKCFALALQADPALLPAIDAAHRLRFEAGGLEAAAHLAERAAQVSADPENVAQAWVDAADIYEGRLGDSTRALRCLQALLQVQPGHRPALERALGMLEAAFDWETAATLLEAHVAAIAEPSTQARCLTQRAAILASRLGDTPGAIRDLRRAMALLPEAEDPTTMEVLAALEERTKNWQEAVQLHGRVARATIDEGIRRRARLAEARIVAEELRDHARAKELLEALAADRLEDREVLLRLALVAGKTGDDARALEIYDQLCASGPAIERARALIALAELKRAHPELSPQARRHPEGATPELSPQARRHPEGATPELSPQARRHPEGATPELSPQARRHPEGATPELSPQARRHPEGATPEAWTVAEVEQAIVRVFDLAIAEPTVIPLLEEWAGRSGDFRPFAAHAEAAIGRVPPNTPGILPMRTSLARAMREQLGNPTAADRHLAAAIKAFPGSMSTRLALAAGLRGRNDDGALAELRAAVESDPTAAEPFAALVTLAVATGRPQIGAMLATAALFLGATGEEVESTLTDAAPLRAKPDSLAFDEAMARLVGPSRAWLLRSVLAAVDPFLPKIFAPAEPQESTRLPDSHALASDVRGIAAALGVVSPPIYRGSGREVTLLFLEPRGLLVGTDWLGEGALPVTEFHCAYSLARVAGCGSVYAAPRPQLAAIIDAVCRPETDGPLVRDFRKRIGSAMPRKNKKDLERLVAQATSVDIRAEHAAWEAEESRRALYAAVLLTRDMRAIGQVLAAEAVTASGEDRRRLLGANTRVREILEFLVSAPCWDAFQRVYGRT